MSACSCVLAADSAFQSCPRSISGLSWPYSSLWRRSALVALLRARSSQPRNTCHGTGEANDGLACGKGRRDRAAHDTRGVQRGGERATGNGGAELQRRPGDLRGRLRRHRHGSPPLRELRHGLRVGHLVRRGQLRSGLPRGPDALRRRLLRPRRVGGPLRWLRPGVRHRRGLRRRQLRHRLPPGSGGLRWRLPRARHLGAPLRRLRRRL